MPWSGSGTFTRYYGASGWTDDKNNGVKILASRHDTHDQDIADGVNACITRDNQAKPTASFLPATDNTINLGSASFRWASINGVTFANFARLDAQNTFTLSLAGSSLQAFANTSNNALASIVVSLGNDAGRLMQIGNTSSTRATTVFTGGPTTEQTFFGSTGAIPISIGTNLVERVRISGDGSVINLQSTSVQVNGTPINVVSAFKAATTTRASTTTPASDSDLSISLVAGTWEISGCLLFTAASDGTQGYKAQLNFSATVINGGMASTWTSGGSTASTGATFSATNIALISLAVNVKTAVPYDMVSFKGTVTLGNTNTVAVQWSQNASNVVGTQLLLMSNLIARRIA